MPTGAKSINRAKGLRGSTLILQLVILNLESVSRCKRLRVSTLNSRFVILNLFQDLTCFNVHKGFALFLLMILGKILSSAKPPQDDSFYSFLLGKVCPTYSIGALFRCWLA